MKNILLLVSVIMLLLSCNRVEHIQSLSQLEPALCRHVGIPNKIDTVYKTQYQPETFIAYQFSASPEVTFKQLVSFLSEALNCKPSVTLEDVRNTAKFTSNSEPYFCDISVVEYQGNDNNKRNLFLLVRDVNNELIPPSSPAPQRVAPQN